MRMWSTICTIGSHLASRIQLLYDSGQLKIICSYLTKYYRSERKVRYVGQNSCLGRQNCIECGQNYIERGQFYIKSIEYKRKGGQKIIDSDHKRDTLFLERMCLPTFLVYTTEVIDVPVLTSPQFVYLFIVILNIVLVSCSLQNFSKCLWIWEIKTKVFTSFLVTIHEMKYTLVVQCIRKTTSQLIVISLFLNRRWTLVGGVENRAGYIFIQHLSQISKNQFSLSSMSHMQKASSNRVVAVVSCTCQKCASVMIL